MAKLNLLSVKSAYKINSKKSKLSSKAAPFTAGSRGNGSSSKKLETIKSAPANEESEGVYFEAICKSISHGTTEEHILDFIKENVFSSIKNEIVKDGMMMLPGESMAVLR